MPKVIKIRRGLDIRLKGAAELKLTEPGLTGLYAVKPPDFKGPEFRVLLKPGAEVKAGTPVLADKQHPEIVLVSPVAGTIREVLRGERRKLLAVIVEANGSSESEKLKKGDPSHMEAGEILRQIQAAGLWPALIQRPYGVVAKPDTTPRDIFISGFDSAPLAPDYSFILKENSEAFTAGINALKKLTSGKVYLSLRQNQAENPLFSGIKEVEATVFSGPHPAGNTGVQMHHLAPLNKGEVVWTVNPQFVALIGKTFLTGLPEFGWTVAVAGSMVKQPGYYKCKLGCQVSPMLKDNIVDGELPPRVISGNVLTGTQMEADGFLGFYDSLISVIPEGKHFDLLGWAAPGLNKFSMSRTFMSSLFPKKSWDLDTNLNGGHRAFVVTGQYEKVFPMDIYPMQLLKAILANDIDKMEQLGIYEVIEEDMALCEFVCTSKIDIQEILRTGLETIRKEMN
jgi:Na+-transporting NADH:ubiquinone oxidoreductase subunit A